MRKPLNTSIPEDLIKRVDQFVAGSNGDFSNRSHLVEQAIRAYIGDELSLYGGLLSRFMSSQNPPQEASLYESTTYPRLSENTIEKQSIGDRALSLIKSEHNLFIDGSTTSITFARALASKRKGLTIVTNSALVALEVGKYNGNRVVGLGGDFDPGTASFTGRGCEESLDSYYFDYAFFSTKGFLVEEGSFESNIPTLRVKQAAAKRCAKVVLLIDHTKFDQRSLCKVLDLSEIHTVVTDAMAPTAALDRLSGKGINVVVADLRPGEPTSD